MSANSMDQNEATISIGMPIAEDRHAKMGRSLIKRALMISAGLLSFLLLGAWGVFLFWVLAFVVQGIASIF